MKSFPFRNIYKKLLQFVIRNWVRFFNRFLKPFFSLERTLKYFTTKGVLIRHKSPFEYKIQKNPIAARAIKIDPMELLEVYKDKKKPIASMEVKLKSIKFCPRLDP